MTNICMSNETVVGGIVLDGEQFVESPPPLSPTYNSLQLAGVQLSELQAAPTPSYLNQRCHVGFATFV